MATTTTQREPAGGFTSKFERLELKFLVDEYQADRIRREINPYCQTDAHCETARGETHAVPQGYPISSLYLDTPGLAFHAAKERGDPERIKLRIRTYSRDSPATLEIKRRRCNIIDKTRAVIARELTEDAALGHLPPEVTLARAGAATKQAAVVADFSYVVATSGARPMLHVRYEREAYESQVDHYARVTFDRAIHAARATPNHNPPSAEEGVHSDWALVPDAEAWCPFDEHWRTDHTTTPIVMEIKCTSHVPAWISDLIVRNQLVQSSFSKYSVGIHVTGWRLGQPRIRSRSLKPLS